MTDVYVNSEELKIVASSIKTKSNSILEIYQSDIMNAINMGNECLQVSGLDSSILLSSFNKIFTNINDRISNLSDFLNNVVANEYDIVSSSIISEFDSNFAGELAKLLGSSILITPSVINNSFKSETIDRPIYVKSNVDIRTGEPLSKLDNGKIDSSNETLSKENLSKSQTPTPWPYQKDTEPAKKSPAIAVNEETEYVTPKAGYFKNGNYKEALQNGKVKDLNSVPQREPEVVINEGIVPQNLRGRDYENDPIRVSPLPSKVIYERPKSQAETVLDSITY